LYKIYLILANTDGIGQWKVGISTNLDKRLQILKTGNPNIVGIETYYKIENKAIAYMVETMIKKTLKPYKVNGEWFTFNALNIEIFKILCEKFEKSANIYQQIQNNINNHKNNTYR